MNDINVSKSNSPYIFSFPHSGTRLIAEMDWQLKPEAQAFLPNCDWHLNELYKFLENYNVNIISTPHSRYVVDVNRSPSVEKFGSYRGSLVYETNTWDEELYDLKPTKEELDRRINRYYKTYHDELEALVMETVAKFGKAYLIDLHSFMGPISEEVCLGNRNNSSSSEAFINKVNEAFVLEGFDVVKNKVFIGGYITKSYAVSNVVETLQIELRYSTYIEAHELDIRAVPSKNSTLFYETALRLEKVMEQIGIEKKISNEPKIENSKRFVWGLGIAFVVMVLLSLMEGISST